jgi:hypothetical protein
LAKFPEKGGLNPLDLTPVFSASSRMGLPSQPITLSVEQIEELNHQLSTMRHDVNNHLALIIAALEVLRYKPQMAENMMATLSEQPKKIMARVGEFSDQLETLVGITK